MGVTRFAPQLFHELKTGAESIANVQSDLANLWADPEYALNCAWAKYRLTVYSSRRSELLSFLSSQQDCLSDSPLAPQTYELRATSLALLYQKHLRLGNTAAQQQIRWAIAEIENSPHALSCIPKKNNDSEERKKQVIRLFSDLHELEFEHTRCDFLACQAPPGSLYAEWIVRHIRKELLAGRLRRRRELLHTQDLLAQHGLLTPGLEADIRLRLAHASGSRISPLLEIVPIPVLQNYLARNENIETYATAIASRISRIRVSNICYPTQEQALGRIADHILKRHFLWLILKDWHVAAGKADQPNVNRLLSALMERIA